MKTKTLLRLALFISITATMVSCGPSENKNASSSSADSTAEIIVVKPTTLDTAECFIKRFLTETDYLVPSAWLFETGIKNMIDNVPDLVGIKFYAAINSERNVNEDSLTLVMIPVVKDNLNLKSDYLMDNYVYEFSDLCPPRCSISQSAINVSPRPKDNSFSVPRSWYFGKDKLDKFFKNNNYSVRLYQYIHDGILDLKMVSVQYVNDTTYNDVVNGNYIAADEICTNSNNNCDNNSRLYNATNCTFKK